MCRFFPSLLQILSALACPSLRSKLLKSAAATIADGRTDGRRHSLSSSQSDWRQARMRGATGRIVDFGWMVGWVVG